MTQGCRILFEDFRSAFSRFQNTLHQEHTQRSLPPPPTCQSTTSSTPCHHWSPPGLCPLPPPHQWRWGGTAGFLVQLHSAASPPGFWDLPWMQTKTASLFLWRQAEVLKVSPQQIICVCVILRLTEEKEGHGNTEVSKTSLKSSNISECFHLNKTSELCLQHRKQPQGFAVITCFNIKATLFTGVITVCSSAAKSLFFSVSGSGGETVNDHRWGFVLQSHFKCKGVKVERV